MVVASSVILVERAARLVSRTDGCAGRGFLVTCSHAMLVDQLSFFQESLVILILSFACLLATE